MVNGIVNTVDPKKKQRARRGGHRVPPAPCRECFTERA